MDSNTLTIATPTARDVVVTRVFASDPESVFDSFTKPEILRLWCCPSGWTFDVCESDPKKGGEWRFRMVQPGGKKIGQFGVYTEIEKPGRIVKTEAWEDWDAGETVVTVDWPNKMVRPL